jgi:mannose-6-phosphate isomerase-like protein (cupin superfamily)
VDAFVTRDLSENADTVAPDGTEVRLLAVLEGCGSMAHFTLHPGQVSRAGRHRTVSEIWYVVSGKGRMWRRKGAQASTAALHTGLSIAIPAGTAFQFRNDGDGPLSAVGVTIPPWPGEEEWLQVDGVWEPEI